MSSCGSFLSLSCQEGRVQWKVEENLVGWAQLRSLKVIKRIEASIMFPSNSRTWDPSKLGVIRTSTPVMLETDVNSMSPGVPGQAVLLDIKE